MAIAHPPTEPVALDANEINPGPTRETINEFLPTTGQLFRESTERWGIRAAGLAVAAVVTGAAVYFTSPYSGRVQAAAAAAAVVAAEAAAVALAYGWAWIVAPRRQRDRICKIMNDHINTRDALSLNVRYDGEVITFGVTNTLYRLSATINVLAPDRHGLMMAPVNPVFHNIGTSDTCRDTDIGGTALRWRQGQLNLSGGRTETPFEFTVGHHIEPFPVKFMIGTDDTGWRQWLISVPGTPSDT